MILIKVDTSGLVRLQSQLTDQAKQVRYATAVALTRTAKAAQEETVREMQRVLHAPTRYTLSSIFTKPATRQKLEAVVYFKDRALLQKGGMKSPADVLRHLVTGGPRAWKNHEEILRRAGILPPGMAAVPGDAAPLNAHGNIPASFIVQLLAYFRTFGEQGYRANMTDRTRARFEARQGRALGGGGAAGARTVGRMSGVPMFRWMFGDPAECVDRRRGLEERVAEAEREAREIDRRRKARRIRKLVKAAMARKGSR
jgi:hypothetical protein